MLYELGKSCASDIPNRHLDNRYVVYGLNPDTGLSDINPWNYITKVGFRMARIVLKCGLGMKTGLLPSLWSNILLDLNRYCD